VFFPCPTSCTNLFRRNTRNNFDVLPHFGTEKLLSCLFCDLSLILSFFRAESTVHGGIQANSELTQLVLSDDEAGLPSTTEVESKKEKKKKKKSKDNKEKKSKDKDKHKKKRKKRDSSSRSQSNSPARKKRRKAKDDSESNEDSADRPDLDDLSVDELKALVAKYVCFFSFLFAFCFISFSNLLTFCPLFLVVRCFGFLLLLLLLLFFFLFIIFYIVHSSETNFNSSTRRFTYQNNTRQSSHSTIGYHATTTRQETARTPFSSGTVPFFLSHNFSSSAFYHSFGSSSVAYSVSPASFSDLL
jgi:DNA mismatch repair ATPase MutL